MNQKFSIKNWSSEDRPREKLLAKGKVSLTDSELLAILIGSGNRNESAVALCKRILASVDNDLNKLGKLSVASLQKFKGIGEAKAISIVAGLELGRRRRAEETIVQKIKSSSSVYHVMRPLIGDLAHEEFWTIYLSNSNKIIHKEQLSKGGMTATLVDVRLLLKKALEVSAVGIILVHNHPSGSLKISTADKQITNKIQEASRTLDIKLLDHVIVTDEAYISFADEGLL